MLFVFFLLAFLRAAIPVQHGTCVNVFVCMCQVLRKYPYCVEDLGFEFNNTSKKILLIWERSDVLAMYIHI